ncbi:MAG: redoxin domain-containing protein [Oligoflexia bacterium]|nr:redoxin domain-containing protein [Oligoflexia bacterium]
MQLVKIFILFLGLSYSASAAEPGKMAEGFSLTSHEGKKVSLSDYKGKIVILEWFNHGCPFVRKHYDSRNIPNMQLAQQSNKDVVWLTIVSSAQGKQGYLGSAKEATAKYKEENMRADAFLLDPSGKVGRMYKAKTTPQFTIIGKDGKIAYAGAIDSIPSSSADDIPHAKNYVELAMDQVLAGKPVKIAKTKPYGCSVKY